MTDTPVTDRPPVALVTGGSRGIGAAVAIGLAEAGCDLIINYRSSSEDAEKVAQSVRERGREATTIAADVSDETAVIAMFREYVPVSVDSTSRCSIPVSPPTGTSRR